MPDAQHDWSEACAEADRLDPGWRWEELLAKRPVLPPERDAIRVALDAAAKLPKDWMTETDDFPISLQDIPKNQRLPASQLSKLRELVESAEPALVAAHRLMEWDVGRSEGGRRPVFLHLTAVNHIGAYGKLRDALRFRAILSCLEGRVDDALADGRRLLAVARAAGEPPMWIGAVMAVAQRFTAVQSMERALAQGEPGEAALAAARADVEKDLRFPLLLESTRGERAVNEDLVREVDAGRVDGAQLREMESLDIRRRTGIQWLDWWIHRLLGGGYRKRHMAGTSEYLTATIELLKQSPDAISNQPAKWAAIRQRAGAKIVKGMETFDKVLEMDRRQRAWLATLAAAFATELFRRQNGNWPRSLEELKETPGDPYTSKPLRYRLLSDGVAIYSLGPNMTDGGGEILIGPGPATEGNFGIRLWNPEARRQWK